MAQSRRAFLAQSLALGCSAAASPLVTPVTFAAVPGENRFVVIVLRGGMDALDIVAPVADPKWKQYRPSLRKNVYSDLDGYFALNPNLSELMPMWVSEELAFAQAVSTPYRDKRSHFDGQDLLEAGVVEVTSDVRDSGWMNRMLGLLPGVKKDTAFSVGRENMLVLRGDFPTTSWAPEGRIDLSPQAQLLLDAVYSKDPLFAEAGKTAMTLAAELTLQEMAESAEGESMGTMMENMQAAAAAQKAGGLAAFAAARLKEDTRFATFSIGGWDTHQKQIRSIRNATRELQSALVTLKSELGRVWDKTCVLCMTEFGRTARENGSGAAVVGCGLFQGPVVCRGGKDRYDVSGRTDVAGNGGKCRRRKHGNHDGKHASSRCGAKGGGAGRFCCGTFERGYPFCDFLNRWMGHAPKADTQYQKCNARTAVCTGNAKIGVGAGLGQNLCFVYDRIWQNGP